MKLFNCTSCGHTVHFDSVACIHCGAPLGFVPDHLAMIALGPDGSADMERKRWVGCANQAYGCNWLLADADVTPFCVACRLDRTIPDLSVPGNIARWQRLEEEKRRLVYSALRLNLPIAPRSERPDGLAFDFLADPDPSFRERDRVLIGHADGVITLNIAEADPVTRVRMREQMDEPYRTILGHFRHESGHFYWDRLVRDGGWLAPYRALFGDDRADYGEALQAYYDHGPPPEWWHGHISAYAASHPWEDWAESWSHYLHIVDTLETAWSYGLAIDPRQTGSDALVAEPGFDPYQPAGFQMLVGRWVPLSVALNSLNRSMGHGAAYPFALSAPVIEKLAFVHRVMHETPPAH